MDYLCPTQEREICSIDCELWKDCVVSPFKNIEIPTPSQFDIEHNVSCKISIMLPDGTIIKRRV